MKKIIFFISISIIFFGCLESVAYKNKTELLNLKSCLTTIHEQLETSNFSFQAIQKLDPNNKLSNVYKLTYRDTLDKLLIDIIEIKKDCNYIRLN
jgi:hypothetical protein